MTIVFEDPELYRRLKVHAAGKGVAMKHVIEAAVAAYLDGAEQGGGAPARRALDWGEWDRFQAELDALAEEPGSEDASDIKGQLYAMPRELTSEGWRHVAEEQAPYDPR
ncbi:MAG: hypothetical protein U5Q44_10760 [Dehalococcoidia bacterium]|nr:hypothetical protein [Dehalococcoidia bacterium]